MKSSNFKFKSFLVQICYVNVRHAIRKLRMPTLCSENAECIWIIIAREYSFLGTMRKSSIKMYFFYFKAFSHVMGYHDGTQNFTIRKYDILAFKWRVLSIFSIPGSKVIPKNKRTLVKCPGLYNHEPRTARYILGFPCHKL